MKVPSSASPDVTPLNFTRLAFSATQLVACLTGFLETPIRSIRSMSVWRSSSISREIDAMTSPSGEPSLCFSNLLGEIASQHRPREVVVQVHVHRLVRHLGPPVGEGPVSRPGG